MSEKNTEREKMLELIKTADAWMLCIFNEKQEQLSVFLKDNDSKHLNLLLMLLSADANIRKNVVEFLKSQNLLNDEQES